MTGDADPLRVGADDIERALSRAKVRKVTLTNSGHFPFWEQPERFLSELRAFIAATERSCGSRIGRLAVQ